MKAEDLAAGDPLPTVFGGARPIQWIARYRYKRSDSTQTWVKDVLRVRIARSALGPEVPSADLFVSQGHPLLIDDVLVPIYNLINNMTIAIYDARALDELEFFISSSKLTMSSTQKVHHAILCGMSTSMRSILLNTFDNTGRRSRKNSMCASVRL